MFGAGQVARLHADFEFERKAPANCMIRSECRWFAQESYAACKRVGS
jgi:hypothetical protein